MSARYPPTDPDDLVREENTQTIISFVIACNPESELPNIIGQRQTTTKFPKGEAAKLRRILRYHGTARCLWVHRDPEEEQDHDVQANQA